METSLETAGLIGVVIALIEVIKILVAKRKRNGSGTATYNRCMGLDPAVKQQIKELLDMHKERYPDGMLKWHTPANLMTAMQQITTTLDEVNRVLSDTAHLVHEMKSKSDFEEAKSRARAEIEAEMRDGGK